MRFAAVLLLLASAWLAPPVLATGPGEEAEQLQELFAVGRRMADPANEDHNARMAAYYFFRAAAAGHAASVEALQSLARNGEPNARFRLGILYFAGKGVTQDLGLASSWWRMAAEQGHGEAQHGLAGLYREGMGLAADPVQAYFWYSLAAAQGEDGARDARDRMRREMPAERIAEAERLAKEWLETRAPR